MRFYALAVYLFLYVPIGIIVLFSFSAGRHASELRGFSVQWYGKAASNPLVMDALTTSLTIAGTTAVLATVMGTMAALALQRVRGTPRMLFDALTYIAIMIPGVVIGITTLIALVTVFGFVNPIIAALWPATLARPPSLSLGYGSVIAAHTMFTMALVIVIVRARIQGMDRALIEASADLYATPWGTFRQVTLPLIFPAVVAGFLLSFTFSFDDFIIAFFVAGAKTTLPIYVFASIRRGITPEINAVATSMLGVSLTLLSATYFIARRRARRITGK
ncbi:MAG: ABC transporter permease [Alphaproteobacteria bacterium]